MKKLLTVLVMFCVIFVVGCGSKNTTNGSSSSPAGTSAASASSEAPKGEVKVMKMATANAKDRSLSRALVKFGEIVDKETNGSIKVEVYPDGQLGGDIQVFEALKIGTVQGSTMSTGPIASFSKRFNIFDLPFLFKDTETAYKILDGDIGQELMNDLPAAGVVGLGYMENGFRDVTNNKREIKTPDDVKGLKIRTLENELHIELWKTLGATPTPMAFTELFTAMEQKVVDGQENPPGNVKLNKFYEVQKYLTKTGHVYNASPLIISNKFWEQLSDQEKEAVKKAAAETITWQREENQKESKEAYEFLAQNGMTVTELTPEDKQKFVDALKPVYDKFKPTIGEDLVNKLLEAAK